MEHYGMLAFGKSGIWELSVDELIGEADEWVLQVESPVISIQCGLLNLSVLADVNRLFTVCDSQARKLAESIQFGSYYGYPVRATLDTEYTDRCFITIGDSANGRFEVTLAGENYHDFQKALSQIVSELELEQ